MFINKEGKLFGKISIIDIVVILVIALLVGGLYTRFKTHDDIRVIDYEEQIEYTVVINNVPKGTLYALEKLGDVYDSNTHQSLGKLISIDSSSATEKHTFSDGTTTEIEIPDKYTATLKLRVPGKVSDAGYFTADNQQLYIGMSLNFQTKYALTSGIINDISRVEK